MLKLFVITYRLLVMNRQTYLKFFLAIMLAVFISTINAQQVTVLSNAEIPTNVRDQYRKYASRQLENYYSALLFIVDNEIIKENFKENFFSGASSRYQPEFKKKKSSTVMHLLPESYMMELCKEYSKEESEACTFTVSEITYDEEFYAPDRVSCYIIATYNLSLEHEGKKLFTRECKAYCHFPSAMDFTNVKFLQIEPVEDIVVYVPSEKVETQMQVTDSKSGTANNTKENENKLHASTYERTFNKANQKTLENINQTDSIVKTLTSESSVLDNSHSVYQHTGLIRSVNFEQLNKGINFKPDIINGLYGFTDSHGHTVISPLYDDAHPFKEGLAMVKHNGQWMFIDKNGKTVISFANDYMHSFSEGLAMVCKDEKIGFIDHNGEIAIPFEYELAHDFENGVSMVRKDGKWGFIDRTGKVVVPFEYEDIKPYSNGLARVRKEGRYGFIDINGNVIIPIRYQDAGFYCDGVANVKQENFWGYIDRSNNTVIPFKYDYAQEFSQGLAGVKYGSVWGFMDRTGAFVIQPIYDGVGKFGEYIEDLAIVRKYDGQGLIDRQGNIVLQPLYRLYKYDGNFAKISDSYDSFKEIKYGVIDKQGEILVPCENEVVIINDSLIWVCKNLKKNIYGLHDGSGQMLIPFGKYKFIGFYHEGLAMVKKGNKYGFINSEYKEAVKVEYDYAWNFNKGIAIVRKGKKHGIINVVGQIVVPIEETSWLKILNTARNMGYQLTYD